MRLDYVHAGDAAKETYALEDIALEGDWAGPLDRWIDETNLGKYQFQVLDRATNRLLYSRGFASVYGEWETTGEAKVRRRAFGESLRFPAPSGPVQVILKKRGAQNEFREVWSVVVDPADPAIKRAPAPKLNVWAVVQNGGLPGTRWTCCFWAMEYTAAEMDKWHRDARRMAELLFAASPFKERRQTFNVWAIDTPSEESGVSRPSDRVYRRSPLGASYDAFDSERYVLAYDNRRLREIASAAPYEFVEIVGERPQSTAGGGIFNVYATVAADNAFTPYIFVHEFGHHFAGLADEYYTSDVAYGQFRRPPGTVGAECDGRSEGFQVGRSPDRGNPASHPLAQNRVRKDGAGCPNATARHPRARAPRGGDGGPVPRPARPRDEITRLRARTPARWACSRDPCTRATGYYRPQQDCIMFTRDEVGFCSVCQRAIGRIIDLYAK